MKNRIKLLVIACIFGRIGFAQNNTHSVDETKSVQVKIKPIIYLLGGIVSAVGEKEMLFAKKYNIVFHDFGCLAPTNLEAYEELNGKTFDLLNIQFGNKWQEELKPTALGFIKWKEKNK
jgi:hypothetical protein